MCPRRDASFVTDDEERTSVQTYVPAYQREVWREEAESMGMSQAEYVRTMVQAGRRKLDLSDDASDAGGESDADPGGRGLETRLLEVLSPGEAMEWDAIVATLTEDVEDRVEDALDDLQRENRVRYSGRHGGYLLRDGE